MTDNFYNDLISMLPLAYAFHRMVYDEIGIACDYEFIEVNHAFEEMTSLTASEIIGKRISQVLPGIYTDKFNWIKTYEEVVLKKTSAKFDKYSEQLGKWFRVFAYSPQDNCFITLFLDITDIAKKSEEQKMINEMLNDIIFKLDENFCFTSILNPDNTALFIPKDEIIGKSIKELFPDNISCFFLEAMQKAKSSGKKESISYRSLIPGEDKWYQATIKFANINTDNKYIVSISDITEQKQLEQKSRESEALFRTIFNQIPVGVAIGNNNKYIISNNKDDPNVNPMFEKITGRTKEELSNISWPDITHPDDLTEDLELFNKFKAREIDGYNMEKRYMRPDGSAVWVHIIIAPLHLEGSEKYNHVCLVEDISRRKAMENALSDSKKSKEVLLDNLPGIAFICKYDRDWTMQFISQGCFELTGYQPKSLLNNNEISYNDLINPRFREQIREKWDKSLADHSKFKDEYELITASGEIKWVLQQGQGVYDESGNVIALEGLVVDITERKKREEKIKYLNQHDYLTDLYNRRYFEDKMKLLDNNNRLPISVLVADINGIRLINDAFGHAEGDRLIKETADLIKSFCRKSDIIARTGGDEFSILMPETTHETALNIMKSIKNACDIHNKSIIKESYSINISLGSSTKTTEVENISQAYKDAEDYMNKRKLLERKSSHSAIMSAIMATMFAKSKETEQHAVRLAEISKMIGVKQGLPQKSLDLLELFSMLHDIGKIGIDDRILNKPDKLSDDEWFEMKKHPEIGYRIAMSSPELEPIAECILTHHERWDGNGYPQGLKGEEIPLFSRILAVADAFDAMTEDRIYRKAVSNKEAIEEIRKHSGTQFDPQIVKTFEEVANEQNFLLKSFKGDS